MKRLLLLAFTLIFVLTGRATISITDGGKYRIVCSYDATGNVVLGDYHSATPFVYYAIGLSSVPSDAWWVVSKNGNGYTICNAISGQYLVYSSQRTSSYMNGQTVYTSKGLQLSSTVSGDEARWTFSESGDYVVISNVLQTAQHFNLRVDGTYLVGTYSDDGQSWGWGDSSASYDAGSLFMLYDEDGKSITGGSDGGGTTDKGSLSTYADSIRLGGKDLIYDSKAQIYYAAIPQAARGGADLTTTLEMRTSRTDGTYTIALDGDITPDANDSITIPSVTCATPYTLSILKDGTEVASSSLQLTFLPIVEVNVSSCNGNYYTTGSIRVTNPEIAGYDSTFIAAYKYRGASAQNYSKKSYAIKLRDAEGNSVDREFFELRNDNNWILDAMAVDEACMRNRVATDLWNDFATKPYHRRAGYEKKAKTGTRGRFVEVFLNGQYHGLYCMTEKIDRKQLRLKKLAEGAYPSITSDDTVHGSLYKSTQWGYEVLMGHESDYKYYPGTAPSSYNNDSKSETWCYYEMKYPDYEEEKIDWGPLWNAINFVCTADDTDFDNNVGTWFDYPVLKDYYLFIELMLATDNHGKNMFFFNYDQLDSKYSKMIGIAPWDLDGTWGRRWDGSSSYTGASQDFDTFLWNYEHGQLTLYTRLQNSTYWNWNDQLKTRYAELRTSGDFGEEELIKRFTDYADLFSESGADTREESLWSSYHSDISGDVDYIKEWIHDRLTYLDNQYDFDTSVLGIDQATSTTPYVGATGGEGCILLHATTQGTSVNIYTLDGRLVRRVSLDNPLTRVDGIAAGVYVVEGNKVLVK